MLKKFEAYFDKIFVVVLLILLVINYFHFAPPADLRTIFIIASYLGLLPVLVSAIRSLNKRQVSVDLLASIALIAAIIAGEWTSVVFINLMLTSARIFGDYTANKARSAIASLLKLRPEKARVKRNGKIIKIATEKIRVGDLVIIESGERISVDGTVTQGEAEVDQSSLTGESVPVAKKSGDPVYSSTLNVAGSLTVRADKVGRDTTLEKIVKMVEESQKNKSKIRTTAEIFATWYIVLTVGGAIIILLFTRNFNLVLSLLLVACADDIAVAVPMAFLAAVGYAARRGVIIKGGEFLEGLTRAKQVLLDKTGTITSGRLKAQDFLVFSGFTEKELLSYAGMAESVSSHPIAKSIVEYVRFRGIKITEPDIFKETTSQGIVIGGQSKKIVCGKISFLEKENVSFDGEQKKIIAREEARGYTLVAVGYNGKPVGFLALADVIRPGTENIIKQFFELGINKIVMLTGDNGKVAARIAKQIGIKDYHANLLPQDKLDFIKKSLSRKYKTIMVGDGVNDAAAISLADIGVAMGAIGSDSAIEAADIALMKDDLSELPEMIELGKYTVQISRQDFWIWGTMNLIGFSLVFMGVIGPVGASAYNFITDFFPLLNSLRLFTLHLKLNKPSFTIKKSGVKLAG
ncbi:MAG: cation-translocating P-type ATPase [Patescibacteria group bacterium]|nr:cation-translocating P-type ATPase [Patescibacteria group bacterium]